MKTDILTKFNKGAIEHTTLHRDMNGIIYNRIKEIMHLKEEATRKALIELGWTPPEEDKNEN